MSLAIRFKEIYDVLTKEALRKYRENRVKTTDREAYFGDGIAFATLDRSVIIISLLVLAPKLLDEGV